MEPHSTQQESRSCKDCHQDPKVLGLGYGTITLRNGKIYFEQIEKPLTGTQITLSQIGNPEGKTVVRFNREGMRAFSREELERILRVGLCLNCHGEKDRIFQIWHEKLRCPRLSFQH